MRKNILGYSDKMTVRPGEEIAFKVSTEEMLEYNAQLVRLNSGDTHSDHANYREVELAASINGDYSGEKQSIAAGSCITVDSKKLTRMLDSFTLAVSFQPTAPECGRQHLLCQWNAIEQNGWSLELNTSGLLTLVMADSQGTTSSISLKQTLKAKSWYRAFVYIDSEQGRLTLECQSSTVVAGQRLFSDLWREDITLTGTVPSAEAPVMIAAAYNGLTSGGALIPSEGFNGYIERPVLYSGVLTHKEAIKVAEGQRPEDLDQRLIADWDFSLGIHTLEVKDRSGNQFDGKVHNLPLRAVKGSCWNGEEMNWQHRPEHYGAIYFHADDLGDCGWKTAITYRIPAGLTSGIYALRLRLGETVGESIACPDEDYIPFFVAAPRHQPAAKVALLLPTYSYLAYGNIGGVEQARLDTGESKEEYYDSYISGPGGMDYALLIHDHPELGKSTYDYHLDGSPIQISSSQRPLLTMRPKSMPFSFCADLLITDWLETKGIDYDVITDDLLHTEGIELLNNYRVVMTGNHPEYPTTKIRDALENFTHQGGRLMYMGANGFYWRCATYDSQPGVVELRRGLTGSGAWKSEVGESYYASSGEMGGLWRDCGRPPQQLLGIGFIAMGAFAEEKSSYRILPGAREGRAGFILDGVDEDVIGNFGVFGNASGQEIDRTNSQYGTPQHTVILARSENHNADMAYAIEEMDPLDPVLEKYQSEVYADMVFFETPGGGAVFSVGSMAWCGSLGANNSNNNISTITSNVIERFVAKEPFEFPSITNNY